MMADAMTPEVKQLQEENEELRLEVRTLKHFIDAMQNVMEVVENAQPDAEIMVLLEDILSSARSTINAKDGSLLVLDEDTNELVFVISQGDVKEEHLHWRKVPPGQGVAGWVAQNRRATIVNDARADERFYGRLDDELEFTTKSILAAPIIGGGKLLGVIELLNKSDRSLFVTSDQTLLTLICRFVGELLFTLIQGNQEIATKKDS